MIHIDGRVVEYVIDFIQNLAPISLCILSVLIFLMKCKQKCRANIILSLKHLKKMSKLMLLQNCLFKTKSVTSLDVYV